MEQLILAKRTCSGGLFTSEVIRTRIISAREKQAMKQIRAQSGQRFTQQARIAAHGKKRTQETIVPRQYSAGESYESRLASLRIARSSSPRKRRYAQSVCSDADFTPKGGIKRRTCLTAHTDFFPHFQHALTARHLPNVFFPSFHRSVHCTPRLSDPRGSRATKRGCVHVCLETRGFHLCAVVCYRFMRSCAYVFAPRSVTHQLGFLQYHPPRLPHSRIAPSSTPVAFGRLLVTLLLLLVYRMCRICAGRVRRE